MQKTLDYIQTHRQRFVEELFELLRIPSISADPAYKDDVLKCAGKVADYLREAGADNVEVCPTKGNPIVYGDKIISAELPTVLVYGHYDVQPADPIELWNHPREYKPAERGVRSRLNPDGKREELSDAHARQRQQKPHHVLIALETDAHQREKQAKEASRQKRDGNADENRDEGVWACRGTFVGIRGVI